MNHLWQSTVFAAVCALLTLALRNNRAQVRYWMWLAASVKFLLPFSILVDAGKYFGRHTVAFMPTVQPQFPAMIEQVSSPFAESAAAAIQPAVTHASFSQWVPAILWTGWAIGFAVLALRWWMRWRAIRAALRAATLVEVAAGVKTMTSPAFAEPGVFGIWYPVLLLPEGIADRLTPPQLGAILAHEVSHVRRRDNLATALHMAVEALYWFHPLVWWIGARLMEERERACDEDVLRLGNQPEAYAEGILKICELYLEPPLACVAGVSGGNLKKRIEEILAQRVALRVSAAKKALIATVSAAAIAAPVWMGVLRAPVVQAQDAKRPDVKFEVASIKACKSDDASGGRGGKKGGGGGGGIGWDPEMLHERCQSLYNLIRDAYLAYPEGKPWASMTREASSPNARGVEHGGCTGCGIGFPPLSQRLFRQELQGAPGWVTSDRYTIDAKAEKPETPEMMRGPMMQTLLEDRFHLKIHKETKDVPVYELTVAPGGPKLKESVDGSCLTFAQVMALPPRRPPGMPQDRMPCGGIWMHDGKTRLPGTTIDGLCQNLSMLLDRDVVDKTGIAGFYDVELDAERVVLPPDDAAAPRDPDMPPPRPETDPLATAKAFQKAFPKIGLKLEPAKGAGVFLVIDHVERPTEN